MGRTFYSEAIAGRSLEKIIASMRMAVKPLTMAEIENLSGVGAGAVYSHVRRMILRGDAVEIKVAPRAGERRTPSRRFALSDKLSVVSTSRAFAARVISDEWAGNPFAVAANAVLPPRGVKGVIHKQPMEVDEAEAA